MQSMQSRSEERAEPAKKPVTDRQETRAEKLAFRWCGISVLAALVVCVSETWLTLGPDGLVDLGQMALTSLLVLGKFVIFLGLHDDTPLSIWSLALMVWLIDLAIAFLLAGGLRNLERTPMFGRWLRRARERALIVLGRYPGLERMAYFGVVAFVLLPLAATGAVTGSFAARLIGLSRIAGVSAIAIGSAGTAVGFALLAQLVGERAEAWAHSPFLIGLFVLGLILAGRSALKRIKRRLST